MHYTFLLQCVIEIVCILLISMKINIGNQSIIIFNDQNFFIINQLLATQMCL